MPDTDLTDAVCLENEPDQHLVMHGGDGLLMATLTRKTMNRVQAANEPRYTCRLAVIAALLIILPLSAQSPSGGAASASRADDGRPRATAAAPRTPERNAVRSGIQRTLDGRPDLEGVWTYGTTTPLERPAQFAGRRVVTDAEAAQFVRQATAERRAVVAGRLGVTEVDDGDRPWLKLNGESVTSIIREPADGRIPPLTAAAQLRFKGLAFDRFDSAEDVALSERCIHGLSGPPLTPNVPFPNLLIVQTAAQIAMLQEAEHEVRIVPLNSREHLPQVLRRWPGDARGRWDRDTLVIDSTNFRDAIAQRRIDSRFGPGLHVVERFTLTSPNELRYDFTVDDPTMFVSAWSGEFTMRRMEKPLYEIACHEGNYALPNMLRGARVQDRSKSEK